MSTTAEEPEHRAARLRRHDRRAHRRRSAARSTGSAGSCRSWAWVVFWLAVAVPLRALRRPVRRRCSTSRSSTTLAYVMMALGLNIVVGFAGLLDLGYVAFFAIGAFVVRLVDVRASSTRQNVHIVVVGHQPRACRASTSTSSSSSCIAAAFTRDVRERSWAPPTLRLRGDYLAIVTLAFGEIVPRVVSRASRSPRRSTSPTAARASPRSTSRGRRSRASTKSLASTSRPFYFIALAMVLVVLFINVRLRDSRLGRAWIAVREDEVAAASMGVRLVRDEAVGLRDRRGDRRLRRRLPRRLPKHRSTSTSLPVRLLHLHPRMVILGGMGDLAGRDPRRGLRCR